MKRTPLKRGTSQLKRTPFRKSTSLGTKQGLKRKIEGNKGKKKTVGYYKKKLWTLFSLFIRQRDNYICFTCGRKAEGSGAHAGHFVPKSVGGLALYFHEENVNCQCYNCNINLGGNQYIYGEKLGKEKADYLYSLKGKITKWTIEDYLQKIEYYKSKLEV